MAKVTGIGGVFFKSKGKGADLGAWYQKNLGLDLERSGGAILRWPDDKAEGRRPRGMERGRAMIMFKDIGVEPIPAHTRDIGKGNVRWDAYIYVPDPDALAEEFASRDVEFFEPLKDTHDGLRGFEIKDVDGYVLFFGPELVNRHDQGNTFRISKRRQRDPAVDGWFDAL